MKIALLFPRFKYPSGDPPLGIGYIASSILKNTSSEVDVIDTTFIRDPLDYLRKKFTEENYALVGVSLMTSMLKDSLNCANLIRKINPKTKILFAGPHPTIMPEETLRNKNVDAVVLCEGELTIVDLIKNSLDFKNVKGLWYKEKGKIVRNLPREPINNLDNLPFPEHKLILTEDYFKNWFQMDVSVGKLRGTNIITSRGCPYNCSYCQPTLKSIFGDKIRKRSPKNIIEELKFLKKKYKINSFFFQDDTFIFDKKWVLEICDELIKNKLNLKWGCNVRANLVTKNLLSKMKSAGLVKVALGIESGSQRVLDDVYHKGITLEQVRNAVNIIKDLDISCRGYFMMGAPTETEEEIKKTIKFANSLGVDEATFSITTPLPHTHLYEKTKGMIIKDVEEFDYYKNPVYSNKITLSPKKLTNLRREALLKFYLSPKRIIKTLQSFISPSEIGTTFYKLKRF
ncbi:MAG: B12-binding domain-containing radical SAM protein [Nanoarchaeota archaeon]|nr:B12-binding domain-containing radical SAM protein [Nanoarchaeota archaeon]